VHSTGIHTHGTLQKERVGTVDGVLVDIGHAKYGLTALRNKTMERKYSDTV